MTNEHAGIASDVQRRYDNKVRVELNPSLMLCSYCDGTGNEFYAMYRACPKCGGGGLVERGDDDE